MKGEEKVQRKDTKAGKREMKNNHVFTIPMPEGLQSQLLRPTQLLILKSLLLLLLSICSFITTCPLCMVFQINFCSIKMTDAVLARWVSRLEHCPI